MFRIMYSYRSYTSILDGEKKSETMNFFVGQKLCGFRWNDPLVRVSQNYMINLIYFYPYVEQIFNTNNAYHFNFVMKD